MPDKFDVVIAGSGFAGSIAALALHKSGCKVCMVEKGRHPRFAIGESSTPIADMILQSLSEKYDLPFLKQLSRYGSWQKHHPELLCGIKRGFSYYRHNPGEVFSTDNKHSNELLVAASSSDRDSDTNWYRADIDAFLVEQAKKAGIDYYDGTTINNITESNNLLHQIDINTDKTRHKLDCEWFIDATGSPSLLYKFFGVISNRNQFHTDSEALFSHFDDVTRWSEYLTQNLEHSTQDYPFDPDRSALHHLIDEGWMWNLRFNNELLSAGFVFDRKNFLNNEPEENKVKLWSRVLSRYPSLIACFRNSSVADIPGQLYYTGRLQRCMDRLYGIRWIALNHTAGFIDPLHSTGIAHTLSGLERILEIFISSGGNHKKIYSGLENHQASFFRELRLIDLLVSGCYMSRSHFELFHAYSMIYFACTIDYEQKRLSGSIPCSFLNAGDKKIREMVKTSYRELTELLNHDLSEKTIEEYINRIRDLIKPYNTAGLLKKNKLNMYSHTAVELGND